MNGMLEVKIRVRNSSLGGSSTTAGEGTVPWPATKVESFVCCIAGNSVIHFSRGAANDVDSSGEETRIRLAISFGDKVGDVLLHWEVNVRLKKQVFALLVEAK